MERFVLIYAGVIAFVGVVFGVAGWFCMRMAENELRRAKAILAGAKELQAQPRKMLPFTIADPGKNRRLGFTSGEDDAG